jgi:hypothetical protein
VAKARPATISWFPWWLKGRMGRWLWRSIALVVVVAACVAGVIWLGQWALEQIRTQDRYLVPFADIDCDAPEGMQRGDFLIEVEYSSRLPERLNVLDEDLPAQLEKGFAHHPWVEKVQGVTVAPPRHVAVRLLFRTPVLAVRTGDELRAVDGDGILLPKSASTSGLPIYAGDAHPPRGPAGTYWGDSDVERAARKLQRAKP